MMQERTTGLPKDWAYSPAIDLELKQYMLLGYVQRVKARFAERKLYPHLTDVRDQAEDLAELQRSKKAFVSTWSLPLVGLDPSTGALLRAEVPDPGALRVIDEVIEFAVPNLRGLLEEGLELKHEIIQRVSFSPVGVLPLYVAEGWLFLRRGREARVYAYSIPTLSGQRPMDGHRGVHTRFVVSSTLGLSNTFERMKAVLIGRYPELPNPATFAVGTDLELPCIETLLPLAKHLVHTHVVAAT